MDIQKELPLAAIDALENDSKIAAIKIVRVTLGLGLKESKDLVEAYLLNRPDLKERLDSQSSFNIEMAIRWLVGLSVVCLLAYYFLFRI